MGRPPKNRELEYEDSSADRLFNDLNAPLAIHYRHPEIRGRDRYSEMQGQFDNQRVSQYLRR